MSIRFQCPGCGKSYTVPNDAAGRSGTCKNCGGRFQVPAPLARQRPQFVQAERIPTPVPAVPDVPCPFCGEAIKATALKCRFCGSDLSGEAAPAPRPPARRRRDDYEDDYDDDYEERRPARRSSRRYLADERQCPFCGEMINIVATKCRHCGEFLNDYGTDPRGGKSRRGESSCKRLTYVLLALFLGGLGIHNFYAGYTTRGVLELVFCWTGIPAIVAIVEAITVTVDSEGRPFQ